MSEVVHRNWGWYEALETIDTKELSSKLKVLVVKCGGALSMQYHNHRSEIWFIAQGEGKLETHGQIINLYPGKTVEISVQQHHRLINSGDNELVVYEIQYGSKCEEEDIVRL